jgi:O-6-methylguanine DNA methyltransferase
MVGCSYCLFDTALGACGIGWQNHGPTNALPAVTLIQLPDITKQLTEERIIKTAAGSCREDQPPPYILEVIGKICSHLQGKSQDFCDIHIDLQGVGSFARQVYAACRTIPAGKTLSYGELAKIIAHPGAARAVGQALGKNPIPLLIPCHRVLTGNRKAGGFSAPGGVETKAKLLAIEGVTIGSLAVIKSGRDLQRFAKTLRVQDSRLSDCLSRPIVFKLRTMQSPLITLVEAVVYQQLSPKAAKTILGRVMDLYPGMDFPGPEDLLKTPDQLLRGAGLSKAKTMAVKDIAQKTIDGVVPSLKELTQLGDDEIIRRLTSISGVGSWTVQMMLIFHLGRIDVLPADDYALRKSVAEVFMMDEIPTPKKVRVLGEAWRPYRTVATLFLWNRLGP